MDGMGAFRKGGRWNSKGTYAVYTASSLALARSELARHVNLESVPDGFSIYKIEVPDQDYPSMAPLPDDWPEDPLSRSTQELGDALLQNPATLGLKVPSVCDPDSFNFILNPRSIYFSKVRVLQNYPFVP
ncbi:MAG: RES domain-containing protein [Cyclobacteriaceae bacterium]|jgi:RES domain-containing protein